MKLIFKIKTNIIWVELTEFEIKLFFMAIVLFAITLNPRMLNYLITISGLLSGLL